MGVNIGRACPRCGTDLFYGGSECASCGWHEPGRTLFHANFAPEPNCVWCNPEGSEPTA